MASILAIFRHLSISSSSSRRWKGILLFFDILMKSQFILQELELHLYNPNSLIIVAMFLEISINLFLQQKVGPTSLISGGG